MFDSRRRLNVFLFKNGTYLLQVASSFVDVFFPLFFSLLFLDMTLPTHNIADAILIFGVQFNVCLFCCKVHPNRKISDGNFLKSVLNGRSLHWVMVSNRLKWIVPYFCYCFLCMITIFVISASPLWCSLFKFLQIHISRLKCGVQLLFVLLLLSGQCGSVAACV